MQNGLIFYTLSSRQAVSPTKKFILQNESIFHTLSSRQAVECISKSTSQIDCQAQQAAGGWMRDNTAASEVERANPIGLRRTIVEILSKLLEGARLTSS